jgi:hypothetical protein
MIPLSDPPSPECSCPVWWTVEEAVQAIEAGYASRMMLEMSPDRAFGVFSPAFKGCEGDFARQIYSRRGCTFLNEGRCMIRVSNPWNAATVTTSAWVPVPVPCRYR